MSDLSCYIIQVWISQRPKEKFSVIVVKCIRHVKLISTYKRPSLKMQFSKWLFSAWPIYPGIRYSCNWLSLLTGNELHAPSQSSSEMKMQHLAGMKLNWIHLANLNELRILFSLLRFLSLIFLGFAKLSFADYWPSWFGWVSNVSMVTDRLEYQGVYYITDISINNLKLPTTRAQ